MNYNYYLKNVELKLLRCLVVKRLILYSVHIGAFKAAVWLLLAKLLVVALEVLEDWLELVVVVTREEERTLPVQVRLGPGKGMMDWMRVQKVTTRCSASAHQAARVGDTGLGRTQGQACAPHHPGGGPHQPGTVTTCVDLYDTLCVSLCARNVCTVLNAVAVLPAVCHMYTHCFRWPFTTLQTISGWLSMAKCLLTC